MRAGGFLIGLEGSCIDVLSFLGIIKQQGNYRYAYQGQEKDPETGWQAFELRMYDGRVGRWMTTDPYSQYHSPYLAMENNPVNMIDPDGGKAFDWYSDGNGSITWRAGDAATIDVNGTEYSNIGTTYHEVIQNDLFIYGEGKTDILAVHDLNEVFQVVSHYSKVITNQESLFNLNLGSQPEWMKIHGTVVGFQFDLGASIPFSEGGAFLGAGFLANGKDYKQTFFGMGGYEYGLQVGNYSEAGIGVSGTVFWGVSHISQDPTIETFAGEGTYFGINHGSAIIQVGISEHWTTFSVGGGIGLLSKSKKLFNNNLVNHANGGVSYTRVWKLYGNY